MIMIMEHKQESGMIVARQGSSGSTRGATFVAVFSHHLQASRVIALLILICHPSIIYFVSDLRAIETAST